MTLDGTRKERDLLIDGIVLFLMYTQLSNGFIRCFYCRLILISMVFTIQYMRFFGGGIFDDMFRGFNQMKQEMEREFEDIEKRIPE